MECKPLEYHSPDKLCTYFCPIVATIMFGITSVVTLPAWFVVVALQPFAAAVFGITTSSYPKRLN
jgi:hypothetical protein